MKCPNYSEILDLIEGRSNQDTSKSLREHIRGCSSCTEVYAGAEKLLGSMRSQQHLYDAPEYAIQKAIDLLPPKKTFADWILAKLEFDSFSAAALAGTRSTASETRHLTYKSDFYQIHLMLETHNKQAVVTGQLSPVQPAAEAAHCLIEVTDNSKLLQEVTTGTAGEFAFEAPRGRQLRIKIHGSPESVLLNCKF